MKAHIVSSAFFHAGGAFQVTICLDFSNMAWAIFLVLGPANIFFSHEPSWNWWCSAVVSFSSHVGIFQFASDLVRVSPLTSAWRSSVGVLAKSWKSAVLDTIEQLIRSVHFGVAPFFTVEVFRSMVLAEANGWVSMHLFMMFLYSEA